MLVHSGPKFAFVKRNKWRIQYYIEVRLNKVLSTTFLDKRFCTLLLHFVFPENKKNQNSMLKWSIPCYAQIWSSIWVGPSRFSGGAGRLLQFSSWVAQFSKHCKALSNTNNVLCTWNNHHDRFRIKRWEIVSIWVGWICLPSVRRHLKDLHNLERKIPDRSSTQGPSYKSFMLWASKFFSRTSGQLTRIEFNAHLFSSA